jgi:metal-sulfur cluster biosynthetic enzyme
MDGEFENGNPVVFEVENDDYFDHSFEYADESSSEAFTSREVFEILRKINDPEHPLTLEQLNVVQLDLVTVSDAANSVKVNFTPTIPHCSMATLIGLCIRVQLLRSLPARFKVCVEITPGTHQSESAVNKQLNDKERVAAALENSHLADAVNKCVGNTIIQ